MRTRSNATTGAIPAPLTRTLTIFTALSHTLLPSPTPGRSLHSPETLKENVPNLPMAPPFFGPDTLFFESNLASTDNLPTATGVKPPFVPRQQRCKKFKGPKTAPSIFEEVYTRLGIGASLVG